MSDETRSVPPWLGQPASRKAFARELRKTGTEAEARLWQRLRGRRILDVKFRRQVPIGPYIVDFASMEPRLVVEIDGSQHAEADHLHRDEQRDTYLRSLGFAVLRVWNNDVSHSLDSVPGAIAALIDERR
ncbi:MAG: endonuclease domain-containing protein [Alphaproteobacteria bacterium]|nr:endonuclease domain-containing protein [Alphaproteobacteria bacterium]